MSAGPSCTLSAALHGITLYGDYLYRTGKLPVMSPNSKFATASSSGNPLRELILIFLAQPGSESEHQLHTLDFVQPIAQRGVNFIFVRGDDAGRAKRAKLGAGDGAIAMDRAIPGRGAPFVVFG